MTSKLDALAPKGTPNLQRLFYTEDEEDAQWSFDQALMSKAELEDVLAELNFDNTDIEIDNTLTY